MKIPIRDMCLVNKKYGDMYELPEGTELILKKRVKDKPVTMRGGEKFVKLNDGAVKRMRKILTSTELAFAIYLVPYVSYEDCVLRKGGHGNGEVMDAKDIAVELDMGERTVYRQIKSLISKGVMGLHETGSILKGYEGKIDRVYTVNPFIYRRGVNVNRVVYEFYRKSGWREMFSEEEEGL